MTIRLHSFLAAMAAGSLCCLVAPGAVWADETPPIQSIGQPVVAAKPAPAKVASRKARPRRSKKAGVKQRSAFVWLSQRILNDTLACNDGPPAKCCDNPSLEPFLCSLRDAPWVYGQLSLGRFGASGDWDGQYRIDIRPLEISFGPFNPFAAPVFVFAQPALLGVESLVVAPGWAALEEPGVYAPAASSSAAPFAYRYWMDKKTSVNAGFVWIHDLGDAQGLAQPSEESGYGAASDTTSALNLTLGASYRAFTLTGGYIRAIAAKLGSADLDVAGNETEPVAWNSELAYSTELLRRETTLAVGYQRSSESLQLYLPEERWRTRASVALFDSATLTLEYYQDREYSGDDGTLDEEEYGVTTKIGFSF